MRRLSVMKKLLLSYILLVLVITILIGLYMLPVQLTKMEQNLEAKISWTCQLLAADSDITEELDAGFFSQQVIQKLDSLYNSAADIDYIVIADKNGRRLYHPDHTLINNTFSGGDEQDILKGSTPYITTRQGNTDVQKRAFHAISSNGTIRGFVMVSASLDTIHKEQSRILLHFLTILLLILAVGIILSYLISKSIRKSLLGFEPGTFAKMYLQREEILDNLNEGILAVDTQHRYLYMNQSAGHFFEGNSLPEDFPLLPEINRCIQTGTAQSGLLLELQQNTLLIHLVPILKFGVNDGVLIIVRDRTEVLRLTEQLTGTNHVIEALRANTHEYLNKLHVISGLLQIGEVKEAIAFISNVSSDIDNGYRTVVRQIHNRTIAALILGKQSHAKELNIQFILRKDSFLEEHISCLSTQELVTIIGNLLENAFDAVKNVPALRQVELFIRSTEQGLTISVDDTGCGMTETQLQKIYDEQYTTKGDGHGVGLRLIQEIIHKHKGYMEIESEPEEVSSFIINFEH